MTTTVLPVEALRAGDQVDHGDEVVRLTSAPWGVPGASREIGTPRVVVHAYGMGAGATTLDQARHLDWPQGTLVRVTRP